MQAVWLLPRKRYLDFHHSVLGLALSLTLTLFLAGVAKCLFGRLRPDWLARCSPLRVNEQYPLDPPGGLATLAVCDPARLEEQIEGMKSFFSGHSAGKPAGKSNAAVSFAGLGFLALFVARQVRLAQHPRGYKVPAVLLPLLLAVFVAATRLSDFRHHWEDVVVGSVIGCLTATLANRIYALDEAPAAISLERCV